LASGAAANAASNSLVERIFPQRSWATSPSALPEKGWLQDCWLQNSSRKQKHAPPKRKPHQKLGRSEEGEERNPRRPPKNRQRNHNQIRISIVGELVASQCEPTRIAESQSRSKGLNRFPHRVRCQSHGARTYPRNCSVTKDQSLSTSHQTQKNHKTRVLCKRSCRASRHGQLIPTFRHHLEKAL